MTTRRWIAGLAAVGVLAAGTLLGGTAASADPTTQSESGRTLAVQESSFPATGGTLQVSGEGYDITLDLYLAVCRADLKQSDELVDCLGGAVPASNSTKAWAVVTAKPDGKKNAVDFADDGSFKASLTIDQPAGAAVNCITTPCALIGRSSGDPSNQPADIKIPLTFAKPTSSSSTTSSSSSSTTTTTTPTAPASVTVDAVSLPQAKIGDQQTVVFSGFQAGEDIKVVVLSDPINLPNVKATSAGVATVSFRVTDAMPVGQHVVQATGQTSNLTGTATFQVLAAPVTTSSSTSSSASTTSSASSTTTVTPTTTSVSVSSTAPVTTTTAPITPVPADGSGSSLWWLWVLLAVVLIGGGIAAVLLYQRRQKQLEEDRLAAEQAVPEAQQEGFLPGPATGPVPPTTGTYETGGMMAGPDDQRLYSGQGNYPLDYPTTAMPDQPTPPTQRIGQPDTPTQRIPTPPPAPQTPPTQQGPAGQSPAGGPPTEAWRRPDEGPATEAWSRSADPEETQAWRRPDDDTPDTDPPTGRHRPS